MAQDRAAESASQKEFLSIIRNAPKSPDLFDFAFGSPTSPFLPLLAIDPKEIPQVETPRQFGAALATGLAGGSVGSGASIEFAPVSFTHLNLSLARYNRLGSLSRIYARSKVGVAFGPGVRADSEGKGAKSSGITASIATKLLDRSDPLLADGDRTLLETCLSEGPKDPENPGSRKGPSPIGQAERAYVALRNAALAEVRLQASKEQLDPESAEVIKREKEALAGAGQAALETIRREFKVCENEVREAFLGRPALDIGLGFRWQGTPGELNDLKGAGTMLWLTFASGNIFAAQGNKRTASPDRRESLFNPAMRFVVHGRYTFDDQFYSDAGFFEGEARSGFFAFGIESLPKHVGIENLFWSARVAWTVQESPKDGVERKDFFRYSGTVSFKLFDGIWLTASGGRAQGKGIQDDHFLLFGLNFAPVVRDTVVSNALATMR